MFDKIAESPQGIQFGNGSHVIILSLTAKGTAFFRKTDCRFQFINLKRF
jgi:hypothetical protein